MCIYTPHQPGVRKYKFGFYSSPRRAAKSGGRPGRPDRSRMHVAYVETDTAFAKWGWRYILFRDKARTPGVQITTESPGPTPAYRPMANKSPGVRAQCRVFARAPSAVLCVVSSLDALFPGSLCAFSTCRFFFCAFSISPCALARFLRLSVAFSPFRRALSENRDKYSARGPFFFARGSFFGASCAARRCAKNAPLFRKFGRNSGWVFRILVGNPTPEKHAEVAGVV